MESEFKQNQLEAITRVCEKRHARGSKIVNLWLEHLINKFKRNDIIVNHCRNLLNKYS